MCIEKQDGCYVGLNDQLEDNSLSWYPIDRHQHQLPNVEDTDTNTDTNQKQVSVEIKPTTGSNYEGIAVGGASQKFNYDTDEEVEPKLCLCKIILLPILFRKVRISFIVVFRTYLAIDEMVMIFSGRLSQTHIIKNKPVIEGYKQFILIESITYYIVSFVPNGRVVLKENKLAEKLTKTLVAR